MSKSLKVIHRCNPVILVDEFIRNHNVIGHFKKKKIIFLMR